MAIDSQHVSVAQKLKLEAKFRSQLKTIYDHIANDATDFYDQEKEPMSLSNYFSSIAGVTFVTWLLTKSRFTKMTNAEFLSNKQIISILNEIAQRDLTNQTKAKDVLNRIKTNADNKNVQHMQNWVFKATTSVSNTNQKDVSTIAALGLSTLAFKSALKDRFASRIDTIAATTVQEAAESTKMFLLESTNAEIKRNLPERKQLQKKWVATLDDRTREAHAEADGQIKDVNEPFEVGGDLLMYPADGSLGAPLSQTINCRCVSVLV